MPILLLLAIAAAQAPAGHRLLAVSGQDTTVYAVTDTIPLPIGDTVDIHPDIVVSGSVLPRTDLWIHNTSPSLLEFSQPIDVGPGDHGGAVFYSADPIRVTGLRQGIAKVMLHWAVEGGGAIFITFGVRAPG